MMTENRRETADAAPHPPIRSGLALIDTESTCVNVDMSTNQGTGRTEGRSDPPVKPTSEVAHQPGQQPAAPRDYPTRQKSARGYPRPETSIERTCRNCGASFIGLAPGRTKEVGIWRYGLIWYCSIECAPRGLE